jgi:phage terminase small subunit
MAMNEQKIRFAQAKLAGKPNKAAAIAAGYSEKTAAQAGSRLAKDPDVIAWLEAHKDEKPQWPVPQAVKPTEPPKPRPLPKPDLSSDDLPGAPDDLARAASDAARKAAAAAATAGFDLDKILTFTDPRDFLRAVMNDAETEQKLRIQAAVCLMPFEHVKKGEGGKKDQQKDAAKAAASKFGAPPPAPRLAANGGKSV